MMQEGDHGKTVPSVQRYKFCDSMWISLKSSIGFVKDLTYKQVFAKFDKIYQVV